MISILSLTQAKMETGPLISEGTRNVKNFLKNLRDVGATHTTLHYIEVCFNA
jgi:hypothetical protein